MHTLDRYVKCARMSRVLAAAIAAACLISLLGAAGAHAAIIKKCPPKKSLEAVAGTALTVRTDKAGMDVFCDYTHPLTKILQDSVNIGVLPLGESEAEFERHAKAYAKALKVPFKTLPGIGNAAWEYTDPVSKLDAGGLPTTTVTIVVGGREVTVISNLTAKRVLAIARYLS